MATPHNNARKGAYAKTVLMPGDPLRAQYVAEKFLTKARLVNNVRNCLGYTGRYKGVPVSVQASGMGMPSIGIYSYELYNNYGVENIIRIGTAGSYSPFIDVRDIVVVSSAYSDSNYAALQNGTPQHVNQPSVALFDTIVKTADSKGIPYMICRAYSTDAFYTEDYMQTYEEIAERTEASCVEMECFALFHNAQVLHKNAACILTISDSFRKKEALTAKERQGALDEMIILALETAARI